MYNNVLNQIHISFCLDLHRNIYLGVDAEYCGLNLKFDNLTLNLIH